MNAPANKPDKPVCRGLYAITDPFLLPEDRLVTAVEQALFGGARLVQYRDKRTVATQRPLNQLSALNALCQRHQVPLIINDDLELAVKIGAAGVHLGKDDLPLAEARAQLGPQAIIGVSCYDRLELALDAARAGADYVAFGSFFPSPTKPTEIRASIKLLQQARAALDLPIVAIGGITPENAPLLLDIGADALAVISALFGQPDIQAAARRFAQLFP